MTDYLFGVAILLLLLLLLGLVRIVRGPGRADRMLATQLFGTAGTALMMLLGLVRDLPALFDVALVMALLAPVTAVAFVRLSEKRT